jgi:hypothetical protein
LLAQKEPYVPTFLPSFLSIIPYVIIALGLYKVVQMSTDMAEMKEILKDIRRNTERAPLSNLDAAEETSTESTANLARALNAAAYAEADAESVTRSEPQR